MTTNSSYQLLLVQHKPTECFEAMYFDGTQDRADQIKKWMGPQVHIFKYLKDVEDSLCFLEIPRTGTTLRAGYGSWILRDSKGLFTVVDTQQFEELYEPSQLV